ncbi:MAG: DUF302 domain-containing protein [Acidimicrobiia bacterium]|nr:DUF302 domain-containing protein [Acidimicrobiia bacterium]
MITFSVSPAGTFDDVVERTRAALADEGFGVLSEIDISETLRVKVGADMRPYVILGACNPPLAKRAIDAEPTIGALLPCNVVVRETVDGVVVDFMDPGAVLDLIDQEVIHEVGREARQRLQRAAAFLDQPI